MKKHDCERRAIPYNMRLNDYLGSSNLYNQMIQNMQLHRQFLFIIGCLLITQVSWSQKVLFNGQNLDGWINYGTEKWYVEDGNLVSESGPDKAYGYLGTVDNYKDFDITLEFKQEANGNSGVFIRSTVEGTTVSGWQVEVAPPGNNTGGIYESYGRGWLIKPTAKKQLVLKEEMWNTLRIRVVGPKIKTWLNGKKMVQLKDEKIGAGEGGIALQIHDGGGIKVRWRNIVLKEL